MAKQNGHTNGTAAKRNGHLLAKPRRPRGPQANFRTPDELQKFQGYIEQLRQWLEALPEKQFDKAIARLSNEELFQINLRNTYENYQKGGLMREIVEGAL